METQWKELYQPFVEFKILQDGCSPFVKAMMMPNLLCLYDNLKEFTTKHPEFEPLLPLDPTNMTTIRCFWNGDTDNGFLSQYYPCSLEVGDKHYGSLEEYITALKIKLSKEGFRKEAKHIIRLGCYLKFSQNPELRQRLLDTKSDILTAAGNDQIFSVELAELDDDVPPEENNNLLGICLMSVRDELRCWAPNTKDIKQNQSTHPSVKRNLSTASPPRVNKQKRRKIDEGTIHVWTDGACPKNGSSHAVAGIGVYFSDRDPRNVSQRFEPYEGMRATNQTAELAAAVKAIEICLDHPHVKKICLHTDSKYTIDCATKWIQQWKRNGWMTSKKTPVKNKPLVEKLWKLAMTNQKNVPVEFIHVRGHSGIHGNECADKLAVAACKLQ